MTHFTTGERVCYPDGTGVGVIIAIILTMDKKRPDRIRVQEDGGGIYQERASRLVYWKGHRRLP